MISEADRAKEADPIGVVYHNKRSGWNVEMGHDRSFGDVGSMSGLPKSGHDWTIYEYTPELDAARRSRALSRASSTAPPARPRHIAAAGDDAEIGTRLLERGWIDVGLGGRRLDHAHGLRPRCERVLEEALGTLAAFWWLHLSIRRARL